MEILLSNTDNDGAVITCLMYGGVYIALTEVVGVTRSSFVFGHLFLPGNSVDARRHEVCLNGHSHFSS